MIYSYRMDALVFVGGALLRFYLFENTFFKNLCDGILFSTPLTSWKRVTEGCFLLSRGSSPYEGDAVHEAAPSLLFYSRLTASLGHCCLPAVFVAVDLLTALVLSRTAQTFTEKQLAEERARPPPSDAAARPPPPLPPWAVAAAYLFNPCTAAACAAMSSAGLHQLPMALVFYSAVSDRWLWCGAWLAVSACLDLYPLALVVPLAAAGGGRPVVVCAAAAAALLTTSVQALGADWYTVMDATYGFILWTRDLTPNVGLFWYFFTEMFQHFESLFIATFQINAFIYAVPLTLRFPGRPTLVMLALLLLLVTFKSYPSVADAGLPLALLLLWRPLAAHARYGFLVTCFYVATLTLAPVMWTLWIHAGSANANFFFAVTLAYNAAQIFLVTDLLFAQLKRDHVLAHGSAAELDGQPAKLVLS